LIDIDRREKQLPPCGSSGENRKAYSIIKVFSRGSGMGIGERSVSHGY